jgi:HAMP domain-containing protein
MGEVILDFYFKRGHLNMEKKSSISNKILFLTLIGSTVGSVIVAVWIYFLLKIYYNAPDAIEKAVISLIVLQILFLIPVLIIKYMIDRFVVERIKKLTEVVSEVSVGNNINKPIIPEGNDEIAELTEAFERMRISLKEALEELES